MQRAVQTGRQKPETTERRRRERIGGYEERLEVNPKFQSRYFRHVFQKGNQATVLVRLNSVLSVKGY